MKHRFFLIAPVFLSIFLFSMMHVLISHANPDISSNNLIVNSIADVTDANPGDGICETSPGNAICTLRAAIQEANALPGEDTIQLPAGTYTLTSGELAITDNVTIIGEDETTTSVNGNQIGRIFHIFGVSAFISNIKIADGIAGEWYGGGGIFNDRNNDYIPGKLTLTNVIVSNNKVTNTGSWNYSGGGILSMGPLTITNSLIENNETTYAHGGGISSQGTAFVQQTTVRNNTAAVYGGGIHAGRVILQGAVIENNSLIEGGYASEGAGLNLSSGASIIENSIIQNNSLSRGLGGGIFIGANASLTISQTIIADNAVTTSNGYTGTRGGGIYSESNQEVSLIDTRIHGNLSNYAGGGIYQNNSIGKMHLIRVTITDNEAESRGAGIYSEAIMSLTNVTMSGNQMIGGTNGEGGGIYAHGQIITITNSTIAYNSAKYGGGIYRDYGVDVILENTILANNTATLDALTHNCSGLITSAGHNLEDGLNCAFSDVGDQASVDPLLSPLVSQINGHRSMLSYPEVPQ